MATLDEAPAAAMTAMYTASALPRPPGVTGMLPASIPKAKAANTAARLTREAGMPTNRIDRTNTRNTASWLEIDPLPYVWSDQYGSKFQILGRIQPDDDAEVLAGSLQESRYLVGFFKSGSLRGVLGRSMPTLVARYRSLLTEPADHAHAREGALMAT